jgi:TBC1 domain family member 5
MIIDILFLYCKLNPDVGGYRQGMHELLAPMLLVVDQDAIDRSSIPVEATAAAAADPSMVEMLDSAYVEHDAFALFATVMERARYFYEVKDQSGQSAFSSQLLRDSGHSSSIVEKSKLIHETYLFKVDPELSNHLTSVEILPQIFLM